MPKYHLAIDIGASSGRHILGYLKDGKIITEEVYRFANGLSLKNGHLCWNMENLVGEVINGIKKCSEIGKIPESIGIDTWGVDFVLLDKNNSIIGDTVGYRDSRTDNIDKDVYKIIGEDDLYSVTGIQKQKYNTIYQLMAVKCQNPEYFDKAETLLMIPEYLTFVLTDVKASEYTNCTTSQLVSPETHDWNRELISKLGFPEKIFMPLKKAGTVVGGFSKEISEKVGFDCKVLLPATHDTASAVVAVPIEQDTALYISSGTWSLLGTELYTANCSKESQEANLTNEGGFDYRFRYLKNIMGLWMLQSVKKEWNNEFSFDDICNAAKASDIKSIVDCQEDRFLAPESMVKAVRDACRESGQAVPETVGEIAAVIYNSLAVCYKKAVTQIENLVSKSYDTIHIVGGGSKDDYLNELTAVATRKTVIAGPSEATALGNLSVQMISLGEFADIHDARRCISKSFPLKKFEN